MLLILNDFDKLVIRLLLLSLYSSKKKKRKNTLIFFIVLRVDLRSCHTSNDFIAQQRQKIIRRK